MKYFEEYTCGCVSKQGSKKSMPGYCAKHGTDRRYLHPVGGFAQEAVDRVAEARAHDPSIVVAAMVDELEGEDGK